MVLSSVYSYFMLRIYFNVIVSGSFGQQNVWKPAITWCTFLVHSNSMHVATTTSMTIYKLFLVTVLTNKLDILTI